MPADEDHADDVQGARADRRRHAGHAAAVALPPDRSDPTHGQAGHIGAATGRPGDELVAHRRSGVGVEWAVRRRAEPVAGDDADLRAGDVTHTHAGAGIADEEHGAAGRTDADHPADDGAAHDDALIQLDRVRPADVEGDRPVESARRSDADDPGRRDAVATAMGLHLQGANRAAGRLVLGGDGARALPFGHLPAQVGDRRGIAARRRNRSDPAPGRAKNAVRTAIQAAEIALHAAAGAAERGAGQIEKTEDGGDDRESDRGAALTSGELTHPLPPRAVHDDLLQPLEVLRAQLQSEHEPREQLEAPRQREGRQIFRDGRRSRTGPLVGAIRRMGGDAAGTESDGWDAGGIHTLLHLRRDT